MGRSRVRSFISNLGGSRNRDESRDAKKLSRNASPSQTPPRWQTPSPDTPSPPSELSPVNGTANRGETIGSRPASTIFSRNPPLMTQTDDTPPELSPIFSFLNIHTNKVYHEGYFLKLNDQDAYGRPTNDRQWTECYAQLVGTVLSLWDATALDAAGGHDVPATFINIGDASLKMIETLPIKNGTAPPLNNVLSLSSAGKNRYLLHFNSFHSLCQWTAAVRLAMYEHTSLYEAYTGALIAGKGKYLNSISAILAPAKFRHEDWARVRFGAGTPWRRCWFVINPPDDKEIARARKAMKKSAYDRLSIPVTGDIQFFETSKTRKVTPIATVSHVYSAYAIYPQSKALIDQSSLLKMEGRITMHGQNQKKPTSTTTEGFVFVMPELHAAVTGLEVMLRFLFPTFDTFNLYGRPTRLVAEANHVKSIMFAFPQDRRFGYLELMDITNLLQTPGSQDWNEAEWRRQLKEATQKRVSAGRSRTNSVNSSQQRYRSSISINNMNSPATGSPRRQLPPLHNPEFNRSSDAVVREIPKSDPPPYHARGMSDTGITQNGPRPGYASLNNSSPDSSAQDLVQRDRQAALARPIMESSEIEHGEQLPPRTPPSPVANPPAFSHGPREMPANRPYATTEQRLANNRMSHSTLTQMTSVGAMAGAAAVAYHDHSSNSSIDRQPQAHHNEPSQLSSNTSSAQFVDTRSSPSPQPARVASNEEIRLAMLTRASLNTNDRPPTPSTTSTPSPQRNLPLDSTRSVKRKPLPQRQIFGNDETNGGEPSLEDLRHTLDEDALNRIAPHLPSPVSHVGNEDDSVYDDAASTVSPDYASTRESLYSKASQKSTKRMGVKKTVGEPTRNDLVIGDARYSTAKPNEPNPDIPTVDFGPTMTYMPTTGRPTTGDTLRQASHQRSDSEAERYRLSVPTGAMDNGHHRSNGQDDQRRSMLWQPGMASNRPTTPGGGLTPEQYVQQRAAPSPPMHMHHRSSSNNTPPPQRPISGDWAHHARSGSRMTNHPDPNYRPSSRGTSPMLNYDVSNHLSAREQEHVARMTNSTFFNMSQDTRKPQVPVQPGGLVSTIDAREREKREMREGMSNQMVQHAIAQRQHHMMNQQHIDPRYAPGPVYPPQAPFRQEAMYNMPGANRTWDAVHQMNRPDETRRSSWYGQLAQAPPTPPHYQQSQPYTQHSQYPSNVNMHY
ncbi:hypothetical protein N7456_002957 [Penicillium angulare]|uniref:PH domain-containing protein n=1 Tax=Penicillium angulare TaxID=116970 RepID=A0A9W9FV76_9EURO|nr:hypothetical protein N7456_002957 [Penicillium angulare]